MARPEVTGKAISTADEDLFLPAARVRKRYGVSSMSIHRWLQDQKLNFPRPIYIGRYRYWKVDELSAWEIARAASRSEAA
jgi:predicted DNA-binding transcriptional regulator AlpA